MEILGSLVGAASGGLLGVAGSLIGKVAGYFETKQKMAQDGKFQLTRLETDSANLIGSYKHDASYGETYKWASSILRFVRPFLTFSVIGVFVFVYHRADEFGDVNTVQRMSNEICFLASTCLSWWFADRSRK